jgi:hypothetical protein
MTHVTLAQPPAPASRLRPAPHGKRLTVTQAAQIRAALIELQDEIAYATRRVELAEARAAAA